MSFPLYKDITKNANDLLRKGYVSAEKYAFRVDFDTTSASGVQLTPYLQRNLDNSIDGELKVKFAHNDFSITSTNNSNQDVTLEIGSSQHSAIGLKWALSATSNINELNDKAKIKGIFEVKKDFTNTQFSIEHPIKQASQKPVEGKATFNTVLGSKEKGLSVGFDTELNLATYSLNGVNTTIAFNKPGEIDFAIFSKKKFGSANGLVVGVNYFQRLVNSRWSETQVASEVSYDLNDKTSAFALGLAFRPSEASTIKTRYDSKGLLGFLYTEKWNGPLTIAFGADWNILGGAGLQHSIKLTFK